MLTFLMTLAVALGVPVLIWHFVGKYVIDRMRQANDPLHARSRKILTG